VARQNEISAGQLYACRSKLSMGAAPGPDNGQGSDLAEALVTNSADTPLSGSNAANVVDSPTSRHIIILLSTVQGLAAAALR
jgi:hypothetical protein